MRKRAARVFRMDGWFSSSVLGKLIAWFVSGEDVVVVEVLLAFEGEGRC
jgi:hypothetical protein